MGKEAIKVGKVRNKRRFGRLTRGKGAFEHRERWSDPYLVGY